MDGDVVRVILRDPDRPEMWERTVALPTSYAEHLVDTGRARWERPRPIGFIRFDAEPEQPDTPR